MASSSTEQLVQDDDAAEKGKEAILANFEFNKGASDEYILSDIEKKFLLAAERGDCAGVGRIIEEYTDKPKEFSINCVDPLNRSALISAIENENFELITMLLENGIQVKDALLHAISEEYVEAVEELLRYEETNHQEGTPYSWEFVDRSKSNFTPDITPLILAAHRNNYEILKVLLDRGATLPMPHDVKCGCDDCISSQEIDSLRYSQSRINAYKALSASSLIALSSRDPVLTAFELSWELKRLQQMESEFSSEYLEMRQNVQEFSTSLLDHARTSEELEIMLNYDHEATTQPWVPGERQTLERLKLAIKYKQKMFVAHPSVQQLLASIWYQGLPGFRRKTAPQQIMDVAKLGCMFPINSCNYLISPNSEKGKLMKKPFVQFINHSSSYAFFLMLLGAASQRVEYLALEFIGLPWMLEILADWRQHERGSFPGPIECFIVLYITSLIFGELKTLYSDGLLEYICDLWNIVDFISNMFYVTWILTRATSWIIVRRDFWYRDIDPWFPREHWHPFDPMLLSEGAFAAGMIFSFLKLVHIFSINPHLGPLQVSLGRMIIDIIKFFFIYTLVLFAFGCGLNQLLWYYAELEKRKCYHIHPDYPDFDDQEKACTIWRRFANLFETSQSLFWASFGLVDLVSFDLAGIKSFTRFWALLMFGSYSVINIIVLLNMLIAMMSNSYQIISERADVEWKFARSKLWMSYFDDGDTLPPPFNMCPSVKMFSKLGKKKERTKSIIRKSLEKAAVQFESVMRLLVRRYVTTEQRTRDDFGITEDDIIEVRQDISSLRFELLEIFNENKMKVPNIDKKTNAGTKKGKVMERRILKDFSIGIVEGLQTELAKEDVKTKDVFSSIAKVIGKRPTFKKKEPAKDWNSMARKNAQNSDPIGSNRATLIRRSQRSLRRAIMENANAGLAMDTNKLLEFNPKLSEVTPTTRVAYVKFMAKTLNKREEFNVISEKEGDAATAPSKPSIKLGALASIKKTEGTPTGEAGQSGVKGAAPGPPVSAVPGPSGSAKPPAAAAPTTTAAATPAAAPAAPQAPPKSKSPSGTSEKKKAPAAPTTPAAPDAQKKDDGNVDQKKPDEKKPDEKKPDEKKPDEKKPDEKKTDEKTEVKKEDEKKEDKKEDEKKNDDKKGDEKTDDDKKAEGGAKPAADTSKTDPKKPAPKKVVLPPSQSAASAGGDRGKSTVTGRMISGWL